MISDVTSSEIEEKFEPDYVSTDNKLADLFAETLPIEKFCSLRSRIGCVSMTKIGALKYRMREGDGENSLTNAN